MTTAAYRVKVVILGDSAVGKTSLLKYFVEGAVPPSSVPTTIGVDFRSKLCTRLVDGKDEQVQVQVWDTAGQERFRTITPMMYKSGMSPNGQTLSMGIVICYDVTNRETFDESVAFWLTQMREHAAANVVTCLVGNKVDLAKAGDRAVPREEAEKWAKDNDVNFFFETSARTGDAVEEMFFNIVDEVLVRILHDEKQPALTSFSPSIVPGATEQPEKKSCCGGGRR